MKGRLPRAGVAAIVGIFLCAGVGRAQANGMDIGVTGGVNLATLTGDDAKDASTITTFMAGLSMIHQFTPMVAFQPEILYTRKGAEFTEGSDNFKVQATYIEVPLLLKIKLGDATMAARPALFIGPYVAYKIGCTVSASGSTSASFDCDDPEIELKAKSIDYGVSAGAGLDFGNLGVFARYSMGLVSVDDSSSAEDIKHRVITVGARWSFSGMR